MKFHLGRKSHSCPFCLEISTHGSSRMLILIPTLVFWIYDPKSILGQIWAKKSKLSILSEKWHIRYLEDADSNSDIIILNFKTEIFFEQIWAKKVGVDHFGWKLAHIVSRGYWLLFRPWFSEFRNLNPFLGRDRSRKWNCLFRLM